MWQYNYAQYGGVLCHHGIKGQKWGVRRYQNEDGTLTALGKKRLSKNGDITFEKGLQLQGITPKKENESTIRNRLKTAAASEDVETFKRVIGGHTISTSGQAFVNKYVTTNDIKLPSVKKQLKIESSLLKDQEVQKELIKSRVKLGVPRKDAIDDINYFAKMKDGKRRRDIIELELADPENKVTIETFENKLKESGYNAYRNLRERGETPLSSSLKAKTSMTVIDPDKNVKIIGSYKLTKEEYAKAQATVTQILREEQKRKHPKWKWSDDESFETLVEHGKEEYDNLIADYKRMQAEFRELEELDKDE